MKITRGFTLIELMVTLAVAIILTAVAVPAYRSVMANNRVISQTNALVTGFQLARAEAVSRGQPVAVCARADDTTCGASTAWANGWLVFVDEDDDGVRDAGEERVRIFASLEGNPTLSVAGGAAVIRYQASGAVEAAEDFQLSQTGSAGSMTRCVSVNTVGQVRTERASCS